MTVPNYHSVRGKAQDIQNAEQEDPAGLQMEMEALGRCV